MIISLSLSLSYLYEIYFIKNEMIAYFKIEQILIFESIEQLKRKMNFK